MALDNPSYFSVSENPLSHVNKSESVTIGSRNGFSAFFRKKTYKTGSMVPMKSEMIKNNLTEESQSSFTRASKNVNSTINGPRRSFRTLFRSVSANAGDDKTLQILKGDPRPSDVAPPSPYLPHRSHSHSDCDKKNNPNRRRALKSTSELLSNDMIFCGLNPDDKSKLNLDNNNQVNHNDDDDNDSEEVFLGLDNARYYNLSATLPSNLSSSKLCKIRRHSIGTLLDDEQKIINCKKGIIQTEGFIKEPDTFAPPIPTDQVDGGPVQQSNDSRRCKRHKSTSRKSSRTRNGSKTKQDGDLNLMENNHEDVVFISSKDSEASTLWVNYLTACFEQISRQQGRAPFKIRHVTVEDFTPTCPNIQDKISKSRIQIIIVCPILLENASNKSDKISSIIKLLSCNRILAMMLGVHDGHLTENQKTALINYTQWRKFFVKDQDETFVGEFLGAAISILGTAPPTSLKNDKTTFSVHPKKVKMSQNKIMVILNDPLKLEDSVNVIVDRCGEGLEITQVKKRNPYTLQFSIPERCLEVSMLVGVRVIINGIPQGVRQVKCESRLRELDQILRAHDNPLEFMCQTFGFHPGDREQLDNWMVHAFQKNLPPRFDLLATPSGSAPLQRNSISPEEYPTLLHFAARFGLEKLAWQLLECPGGEVACDLRNVAELTPADLAEQSGHIKLAHQLRGYMQMNEFTNMYSYLKVISENVSNSQVNNENVTPGVNLNCLDGEQSKEDYCRPRPLNEAYLIPPAARPVVPSTSTPTPTSSSPQLSIPNDMINYSIVPPPTPIFGMPSSTDNNNQINGLTLPLQGYLKMNPANPKLSSPANTPVTAPLMPLKHSSTSQSIHKDNSMNYDDNISQLCKSDNLNRSLSNQGNGIGNKHHDTSGPQDELLEIINDFKNNVFTISEVERLVENWRNRNDVQQSFKDKQRQLAAMRDEYERIQKRMKEELKAPTPFDKIKKFFTKNKKDIKELNDQDDDSATNNINSNNKNDKTVGINDRRPISSLSFHSVSSSSSSGRISIISGCSGTSFGDSGTHSDPEDRKLRNLKEEKSGMSAYEIPPTPKPFTRGCSPMRYAPFPRLNLQSSPLPSTEEYYIAYPVSGLPIHSSDKNVKEPKTPSSPFETINFLTPTNSLSEEQKNVKKGENNEIEVKEINQLSTSSTPSSPPTHIPLDYMNITPMNIPNCISNANINTNGNSSKILNNEMVIKGSDEILEERVSENFQQMNIKSDHVSSIDVVDAPRLPEYMNIQPTCDQDKIVVGLNGLAPPVPPRVPAKK